MSLPGNIGLLARMPTPASSQYGDVDGPASATDKAIAIFNGTTGKIIQNSAITLTGTALLGIGATDVSITAGGTNQNITLTPSGTGVVVSSLKTTFLDTLNFASAGAQGVLTWGSSRLILRGATGNGLGFQVNGSTSDAVRIATTGNLLLGGLTTDGTGVLQFPTATTSAGGISFSTDTAFYRVAAGSLNVDRLSGNGSGVFFCDAGTAKVQFFNDGTNTYLDARSGGTFNIRPAPGSGTTSLGFDSSGNATFGLKATVTKPLITVPSALSYASPTSIDVTLSSCFTVTTINATGSVTFNASASGTAGQEMNILITNDATSAKTITFGTNFKSTGTLACSAASRQATITFKSDGTNFLETGRAVLTT